MKFENFEVWITIKNDNPDMKDFSEARAKLYEIGLDETRYKVGIALEPKQWTNFLSNMSRFEAMFTTNMPTQEKVYREIMGFPVRLLK